MIFIHKEHTFKMKNNIDRGISVHKVAMIKSQLKSHMKDCCLWCNAILKLLPPINNWTKCLMRELDQFMTCTIQK